MTFSRYFVQPDGTRPLKVNTEPNPLAEQPIVVVVVVLDVVVDVDDVDVVGVEMSEPIVES